ncbi:MAG: Nucleotidyltransferase domain protein [candidate division TM6 bacterium GW2011_GWF2_28_16]|nr:MAG: Nucleotidyltransferase domain protein [candidate division TM6 bacterium GW2011_GWF2_28_16]
MKNILDEIKNRLVKVYSPTKIYLFGSSAWGKQTPESDLDLLILIPESNERSYKRAIKGELALADLLVSRDLLVYTEKEFESLASDVTTLCYKIKKEGKVIYANA